MTDPHTMDATIGDRGCSLDDVLRTGELGRRPSRPPDYAAEAEALGALAQTLAANPRGLLQQVVETARVLCGADSAGVSILEPDDEAGDEPGGGHGILRWCAMTGPYAVHLNGTMRREASPCGEVMQRDQVLLFDRPERHYQTAPAAGPPIHENLLAPWHVDGAPGGTLWVIAHAPERHFDAEDARLLASLARFAAAAWQTVRALEAAEAGRHAVERRVEERTRALDAANAGLRASEGRARTLLAMLPGAAAFVVDQELRYQLADGEALRAAGFASETFVGRTVAEVLDPALTAEYAPRFRQALAGAPFEWEHAAHGRVFLSRGVPLRDAADGRVAAALAVSVDVTAQRAAEAALRASEERQAFLLRLSDALRPLTDATTILTTANRTLGEHLGADRTYYVELDHARGLAVVERDYVREHARGGVPSLAGTHPRAAFEAVLAPLRAGQPFVCEDAAEEPRISESDRAAYLDRALRAFVTVPLIKGGQLVGTMSLTNAEPRAWRSEEVALVQEVAERTWEAVTRARAEAAHAASDARYRTLFETMGQGYGELELVRDADGRAVDHRYLALNPAFERHFGVAAAEATGRTAREVFPALEPWWHAAFDRIARQGVPERIAYALVPLGRWFEAFVYPRGGDRLTVLYEDVTERRNAEEALRASEERLHVALAAAELGAWVWHIPEDRTEADAQALAHFGLAPSTPITLAEALVTTFHPEDAPVYAAAVARAADPQGPGTLQVEFRVRRPDGQERWMAVSATTTFEGPFEGAPRAAVRMTGVLADVTARKQAEATLRASEARFRALATASADVLYRMSPDWSEMRQLDGRGVLSDTDEPSGTWLGRYIHPDDQARVSAAIGEAVAAKRVFAFEHRVVRADGTFGWVASRAVPLLDAAGAIVEWIGTASDVTARKQAEDALRDSEARYRHIVEGARDYAILTTDPDGRITEWAPGAEAVFGWTAAEIVGRHAEVTYTAEDRAAGVPAAERATARADGVAPNVRWHVRKDGARVFIDGVARALRDDAGALRGFLKVGQDVTRRRELDEALRASEARVRTLVEHVRDYAIFLLDAEGRVTEWPAGAQRVKGYRPAEVVGRHLALFYTPEDVAAGEPARHLAQAAATGHGEWEGWRVRQDGTRFWANEIATAVRDAEGRLVGFTKISRDLTERRLAEHAAEQAQLQAARDELRRQLAQAEEAERRRLARELHDQLGQHLTGFTLGLAEARRRLADSRGAAAEQLETATHQTSVHAASVHAASVRAVEASLARLEELARLMTRDARTLALELRPPELDDVGLINAVDTYVRAWAERTGVAAELAVTGLHEPEVPAEVGSALYRILQEALTNVAKHAGASRVSVIVEQPDGEVGLIVEDDGRGFEADATAVRVRQERRLGLAGMRERAALVGGTVAVESAPGAGTTVYVRLPVPPAPGESPRVPAPPGADEPGGA